MKELLHLLILDNCFILAQLELEEALLRADERNWCIVNRGSDPAIVMGISGKPEKLLHGSKVTQHGIPVIRRFSGGGTVVVDNNTLFTTFIANQSFAPIAQQPEAIMQWSEQFYKEVFDHAEFRLRENDYVLGEKKFGGNAQYIRKNRWLHHTSFLWDYNPERMACLQLPEKTPAYRNCRSHSDFLCVLKDHYPSQEEIIQSINRVLHRKYSVVPVSLQEAQEVLSKPRRQSTTTLPASLLP